MNFKRLMLLALWPVCSLLHAACPDDAAVKVYLTDFAKRQISKGFGADLSAADAECAKQKLGAQLPLYLGKRIGYKAGFTTVVSQQKYGMDGPRWGYLFDRNMVDIIAVLPSNFGARPHIEASLMVEVKDAGLAEARTPLEALSHLESLVPFIELTDLMLEEPLTGQNLSAINLGFRGGVTGAELPLTADQATVDALANMTVVMRDQHQNGQELGKTQGRTLMLHPLNVAMWLAQTLKKNGITLKKGDVLSLGSFFPPMPAQSGMHLQLQYQGLPGNPAVNVELN